MPSSRRSRLIAFIGAGVLSVSLSTPAAGQALAPNTPRDYSVTHWEQYDGLDLGYVLCIAQGPNGYLWLGTSHGVVRFDGARFRTAQDLGLPLAAGEVNAVTFTPDGAMWVGYVQSFGPEQDFVSRVQNGVVTNYGTRDGIEGPIVNILAGGDGSIWLGGFRGLFRFRHGRMERASLAPNMPPSAIGGLLEDRHENIWVGSSDGVFRLRPGADAFEHVAGSDFVPGLAEDANGGIWVTSRTGGFSRVDETRSRRPGDQRRGRGWRLLIDHRNQMWVATRGQSLWHVPLGGDDSPRINVFSATEGFAAAMVSSVFEDRENNIWVGTTSGLYRLSATGVASTVTSESVTAMAAVRDGGVWLGTTDGWLKRARETDQTSSVSIDSFEAISAVHVDRLGTTWVSSSDNLYRLANGRLARVRPNASSAFLQIASLASDAEGRLLVADNARGLYQWDGRAFSVVPTGRPLPNPSSVVVGATGRLLVGFNGADLAVREQQGDWEYFSSGHGLSSGRTVIFEDDDRIVWFGGINGLSRLRNGEFRTLAPGSGFPKTAVSAILDDDLGYLWCATPAGILRLKKTELDKAFVDAAYPLTYRVFTSADGTAGVPWSWSGGPSAAKQANGDLWFATSRGVTSIKPGNVTDETTPLARIGSVAADDRVLRADATDVTTLPPRTSRLQFDFNSLTLTNLTPIRFRYRLDGFDADWQIADAGRQAVYTNLPPGQYRFRAAASRNGAEWSPEEATWEFAIQPAYYQTAWFYALVATLLALAVALAWRLRIRGIRRSLALVAGERLRIGREIHDHLLQDLFGMRLKLDDLAKRIVTSGTVPGASALLEKVVAIRSQVDESVRATRHAVWDLRPTPKDDLPAVLRDTGSRATEGTGIAFDLVVTGRPCPLHRSIEEQLLQIGREAVNNAVRHARPRRISMTLDYGTRQISLRIVDDGVGFDQARGFDSSEQHFGLAIMRERTETIGGRLEIATSVEGGTEVKVTLPVTEERVA